MEEDLNKENDKLRIEINKFLPINRKSNLKIWVMINKLIDNEIRQEDLCNQ